MIICKHTEIKITREGGADIIIQKYTIYHCLWAQSKKIQSFRKLVNHSNANYKAIFETDDNVGNPYDRLCIN